MALEAARLPARVDESGDLILLESQDRGRWDQRLIALGFHHFDRSIAGDEVSEYHVQAAIAATHARAVDPHSRDWPMILDLYDQLLALNRSPVVALNRAVAVAKVRGPAEALAGASSRWRAIRSCAITICCWPCAGICCWNSAGATEAAGCFRAALDCPCSDPERRFLRAQTEGLQIRGRRYNTGSRGRLMKFSSDDFKRLYAEMPDEELRALVREELSEAARPCYDAELARRGLQAPKPRRAIQALAVPDEPAAVAPESDDVPEEAVEQEEEEDLAPAAIFTSRVEAAAAKALLQSSAIAAFLEDDSPAAGGFRLLVAASYVDQAREVLGNATASPAV